MAPRCLRGSGLLEEPASALEVISLAAAGKAGGKRVFERRDYGSGIILQERSRYNVGLLMQCRAGGKEVSGK